MIDSAHADRIAFINNTVPVYYREIPVYLQRIQQLIADVRATDVVVISVKSPMDRILCFLACFALEVSVLPIDCKLIQQEEELLSRLPVKYILTNDKPLHSDALSCDLLNSSIYATRQEPASAGIEKNQLLLLTSGSTGKKKCVMHDKQKILANAKQVSVYSQAMPGETSLFILPVHYSYGISELFVALLSGMTLMVSEQHFLNELILHQLLQYPINRIASTPLFYHFLSNQLNQTTVEQIKELKIIMSAGGYIKQDVIARIVRHLPQVQFINNYGMTEAAPRLAYAIYTANDEKEKPLTPLNGVIFDVINPDEHGLGEIAIQSQYWMNGYYQQPANTIDFIQTGDIGRVNANRVYIQGRMDSMIKINGHKVYKHDLEKKILAAHPDIHLVRVHSIETQTGIIIEAVLYMVTLNSAIQSAIRNRIREVCYYYERPHKVIFHQVAHLNSNGKVEKVL